MVIEICIEYPRGEHDGACLQKECAALKNWYVIIVTGINTPVPAARVRNWEGGDLSAGVGMKKRQIEASAGYGPTARVTQNADGIGTGAIGVHCALRLALWRVAGPP